MEGGEVGPEAAAEVREDVGRELELGDATQEAAFLGRCRGEPRGERRKVRDRPRSHAVPQRHARQVSTRTQLRRPSRVALEPLLGAVEALDRRQFRGPRPLVPRQMGRDDEAAQARRWPRPRPPVDADREPLPVPELPQRRLSQILRVVEVPRHAVPFRQAARRRGGPRRLQPEVPVPGHAHRAQRRRDPGGTQPGEVRHAPGVDERSDDVPGRTGHADHEHRSRQRHCHRAGLSLSRRRLLPDAARPPRLSSPRGSRPTPRGRRHRASRRTSTRDRPGRRPRTAARRTRSRSAP